MESSHNLNQLYKKIGLYKIINTENGRFYIGSGKLWSRYIAHKYKLKKDKHINYNLQEDWNKLGANKFIFQVTEFCDSFKQAYEKEQQWLNFWWDTGFLYNISKYANRPHPTKTPVSCFTMEGKHIRDFSYKLEAAEFCGLKSSHSIKMVIEGKLHQAGGYRWANKGGSPIIREKRYYNCHSKEVSYIDKNGVIHKYRSASEAARHFGYSYSSVARWCRGESQSPIPGKWGYAGGKYTISHKLFSRGTPIDQYDLNGSFIKRYKSYTEAAKTNKTSTTAISKVCKGNFRIAGGYYWARAGTNPLMLDLFRNDHTCIKVFRIIDNTKEIFDSMQKASLSVGVSNPTIKRWCEDGRAAKSKVEWGFVN